MLEAIIKILAHTPIWAFAVFAWLIFIGIRSTKNREIRLNGLLVTPVTFSLFYMYDLTKIDIISLVFLSVALVLMTLGTTYFLQNEPIVQNKDGKFIRSGSCSTLICGMVTFFVRYFCEYKKATVGDPYLVLRLISSAIIGGFSVGKNLKFFIHTKKS